MNTLELASELAEATIEKLQLSSLEFGESKYPNGIHKEEDNGDVIYTEEAQDDFNQFYDEYSSLIKKLQDDKKLSFLITHESKIIGVVNTDPKGFMFKENIITACKEDFCFENGQLLDTSLDPNNFIGNPAEITIKLSSPDEEEQLYNVRIEPITIY